MAFFFLYLAVRALLDALFVAGAASLDVKDVELLVLRHDNRRERPAPRRIGHSWSQFLRVQAESVIGGAAGSGLADILCVGTAAASRPRDDRQVATVEANDERAPSTQPHTPARPQTRPNHPALALARPPPHLRPCRHPYAPDRPETAADPLTADGAVTSVGGLQRAGPAQYRHPPTPWSRREASAFTSSEPKQLPGKFGPSFFTRHGLEH